MHTFEITNRWGIRIWLGKAKDKDDAILLMMITCKYPSDYDPLQITRGAYAMKVEQMD